MKAAPLPEPEPRKDGGQHIGDDRAHHERHPPRGTRSAFRPGAPGGVQILSEVRGECTVHLVELRLEAVEPSVEAPRVSRAGHRAIPFRAASAASAAMFSESSVRGIRGSSRASLQSIGAGYTPVNRAGACCHRDQSGRLAGPE